MTRPSSAVWLIPVVLFCGATSAATDLTRPEVCGIWPELAPRGESAQEIERTLAARA